MVPPSIFGNIRSSPFVQTATAITPREPDKRNVTADSRTLYAAAREDALDVVDSFSNILKYCAVLYCPEHLVDVFNPTSIKIVKLNGFPPDVEYYLLIKDDFHVETYWRHMKVLIRDLINWFSSTVTKYSQIDTIVDRLKSTLLNAPCELRSMIQHIYSKTCITIGCPKKLEL